MSNYYADISVIIPIYNSSKTLERAIISVSKQYLLPREVILVDDFSSDSSIKPLIKKLKNKYSNFFEIKDLYLNRNLGPGSARNYGLENAKYEYIAFLDSDDIWYPQKLYIQYQFMQSNKDIYFSCHHMDIIKDTKIFDENKFKGKVFNLNDKKIIAIDPIRYLFKHYPKGGTPSIMLKKVDFLRFADNKRYSEDYLLWLEYNFNFRGILLDLSLAASYKDIYGSSGLSSSLLKMEKGELETFMILYKKRYISFLMMSMASVFSIIKFFRRIMICYFRE